MVSVRINGEDSAIRGEGLPKFTDLVELIKSSIDPDHMITGLLIDGRELEEEEWAAPMGHFGETTILEVQTGHPMEYVGERLRGAPDIIRRCYMEFREARKCFETGDTMDGNRALAGAVHTLQAFFEWYQTMMELIPEDERKACNISTDVEEITEICRDICQKQL